MCLQSHEDFFLLFPVGLWRFVNSQSSEAYEISVGIPQVSLFGPTFFLLKLTIYPGTFSDNTTVYKITSQNLDVRSLAADLSSGRALRVQRAQSWLLTINSSKPKLVLFHHWSNSEISPVTMNPGTLKEIPYFEHLLELKFTRGLK